jgi:DNA polymerase (family 10)
MSNKELAKIFYEIADYLKMEDIDFKPAAYRKAAVGVENLEEDIEKVYKEGGLKELEKISGVGKSIALKIAEYLKTGKIRHYEKLKKKTPLNLREIITVEGTGPKRAKVLYQKLGIRNLKELEEAAKAHKISPLFGFGEKAERNILEGIEFLKRSKGRFLLGRIMPAARKILEKLKSLKEVGQISMAGSIRRMKETIGDVDILAAPKNLYPAGKKSSGEAKKIMDFFVSRPGVVKILGKGPTKSSVRTKAGFDIDLRIVPAKSYGSALQYLTGSKEHNIATRKIAAEKGLKLNEYGVFRGKRMIAGRPRKKFIKQSGFLGFRRK